MARERGLVLADTKYEFGRLDGKLILIDEIHTPDSSRYFYADSYDKYVGGDKAEAPRQLSKEFLREWLMDKGFSGQDGQAIPDFDDEFITQVSERYVELYEKMSGQAFVKPADGDVLARIEANVKTYLEKNPA
jgi:phosphoribosylaminoimidazole-succinocarboxamide synthase